jgi:DNA polymerase III subunit epsilon
MRLIDLWKQQLGGSTYPAKGRRDAEAIAYARRLQRDRKQMEHLTLPLTELPVAAFDLETTGFSPGKGDTILSIGAVTINRGKTEEFYSLIYSDKSPPAHITELTGITGEQLKEAPSAEHVLKDFLYFIEGRTLAAHHASHERRFMEKILWDLFRMKFNYRFLIHPTWQLFCLPINHCIRWRNAAATLTYHWQRDIMHWRMRRLLQNYGRCVRKNLRRKIVCH